MLDVSSTSSEDEDEVAAPPGNELRYQHFQDKPAEDGLEKLKRKARKERKKAKKEKKDKEEKDRKLKKKKKEKDSERYSDRKML